VIWAPSHNIYFLGCIFATKAYVDNRKKLLNSNISSTCRHIMVNIGPLTPEIFWRVWGTPQISTGFASWLCYCTDVAQRRSAAKRCRMFGRLLRCYTIYTFLGPCPLTEFCNVQNSVCVQVLSSPILEALLHDTRAAAVSQRSWRGARNGITELSQRVPPIFGWEATTLAIGPHSSS